MIVEQTAVIIENSREYKDFIFNIDNTQRGEYMDYNYVKKFIELSINLILSKIIEISKL